MSYLKSAPSNLSNSKILWKEWKCRNIGPKLPYFELFGLECKKELLPDLKSASSNLSDIKSLWSKWKNINLGPKMPELSLFGLEFKDNIVIFEIGIVEFSLTTKVFEEIKMLDFWTKKLHFGISRLQILKNYCHILSHRPQFSQIGKFFQRMKTLKYGSKNSLFGYFCVRFLKKCWYIWNKPPLIYLIAKFCE